MPGKKKIIKKIVDNIKPPKPPKKPKNTGKNTNKNTSTTKNTKNKKPKVVDTKGQSSFDAAKVILKNTKDNAKTTGKNLLKYGTILAGLKETLGDWTGLTDLIMGKNKPPKNKENYDADPGLKKGDDMGGHDYSNPSAFAEGGSVYTDKGVKVPGMKIGGTLKKGKDGGYYR
jgi:hypothetical protein